MTQLKMWNRKKVLINCEVKVSNFINFFTETTVKRFYGIGPSPLLSWNTDLSIFEMQIKLIASLQELACNLRAVLMYTSHSLFSLNFSSTNVISFDQKRVTLA